MSLELDLKSILLFADSFFTLNNILINNNKAILLINDTILDSKDI